MADSINNYLDDIVSKQWQRDWILQHFCPMAFSSFQIMIFSKSFGCFSCCFAISPEPCVASNFTDEISFCLLHLSFCSSCLPSFCFFPEIFCISIEILYSSTRFVLQWQKLNCSYYELQVSLSQWTTALGLGFL